MVIDEFHQYYPILCELQRKLQGGGSLLYTWNSGLGTNFWATIAYYAASPLNLLAVLVPDTLLREFLAFLTALKIGLCGLFMSVYLMNANRENYEEISIFSTCFAFCAFITGYYWNIIWLDTVMLLPLVALGIERLVADRRAVLYTLSLSLSVFTNFYLGWMVCLFTALYFAVRCVCERLCFRELLGRFFLIARASAAGLLMTAVLTLPAYYALSYTSGYGAEFPTAAKFYYSLSEFAAQLMPFAQPTTMQGLPNLYTGLGALLLAIAYFFNRATPLKERLLTATLLLLLLLSCDLNILDFIWHGFHYPNMLPARFTFIFSFLLAAVAYRSAARSGRFENFDRRSLAAAAAALLLFVTALIVEGEYLRGAGPLILGSAYVVFPLLRAGGRISSRLCYIALCTLIFAEMTASGIVGLATVGTTNRSAYPAYQKEISAALKDLEDKDPEFRRIDVDAWHTINDPFLYGYRGVSQFLSTINSNVTTLLNKLGMAAEAPRNRYLYTPTSPLSDMFLDVKYTLYKNTENPDTLAYEHIGEYGEVNIYQNKYTLALGFMTESKLLHFDGTKGTPFDHQNEFFSLSTGIEDKLFTEIAFDGAESEAFTLSRYKNGVYKYNLSDDDKDRKIVLTCTADADGYYYAYIDPKGCKSVGVTVGNSDESISRNVTHGVYIFPVGRLDAGESFTLSCPILTAESGRISVNAARLSEDLLNRAYTMLSDEELKITSFGETEITGSITATKDGLFCTSIPYERGWTLYVDGREAVIRPLCDAFIAAKLDKGAHEIRLIYQPEGLKTGALLSLIGLLLFLVPELVRRKPFRKHHRSSVLST
jgi:uncharacterized membrane protein YfhO